MNRAIGKEMYIFLHNTEKGKTGREITGIEIEKGIER